MRKLFSVIMIMAMVAVVTSCSKKETTEGDDLGTVAEGIGQGGSDYNQAGSLRSVNFEYDKAGITAEAQEILTANAEWLNANPE